MVEPDHDASKEKATLPAPVIVALESCPSFAEQRPTQPKPLWLERHGTLQRAYESFIEAKKHPNRNDKSSGGDELAPYLPSWDIAKSNLWLLVEAALLQTHPLPAESPQPLPSSPAAAQLSPSGRHHALASPFSLPHTPLAPVPEDAPQEDLQDGPLAGASSASATTAGRTRHELPIMRFRSAVASTLLPTPRGMAGSPPLARLPSLASVVRAASAAGRPGEAGSAGDEAAASAREGASPPAGTGATEGTEEAVGEGVLCPKKRTVAFAAGLAAATSSAAAVASVAAASLEVMTAVAPGLGAASGLLQLGGKALGAGAAVVVDKVQNHISRHVTSLVTEVILGDEAHPTHREHLVARVQATVAGASVLWFLFNLHSMSDTLAHLDFEHDFNTSAKLVLDLLTSGPALLENCKDLMQIGVAVGLGVAERGTEASGSIAADGQVGGVGEAVARALSDLGSSLYSELGNSMYSELSGGQ